MYDYLAIIQGDERCLLLPSVGNASAARIVAFADVVVPPTNANDNDDLCSNIDDDDRAARKIQPSFTRSRRPHRILREEPIYVYSGRKRFNYKLTHSPPNTHSSSDGGGSFCRRPPPSLCVSLQTRD